MVVKIRARGGHTTNPSDIIGVQRLTFVFADSIRDPAQILAVVMVAVWGVALVRVVLATPRLRPNLTYSTALVHQRESRI